MKLWHPAYGRRLTRAACAGLLSLWACGLAPAAEPLVLPGVVLKDFVWPDYYPPPREKQLRFRLQAAEATPGEGGWVQVRQVTLERFSPQGQSELRVRAEGCRFHTGTQEAQSAGPLELELQSGRLRLEGVGFLWRQSNTWLVVSNRVKTGLRGGWLPRPGTAAAATGGGETAALEQVQIGADQFFYDGQRGQAEFRGRVRVAGSNLVLRCERLHFDVAGGPEGQIRQVRAQGSVELEAEGWKARAASATLHPVQQQVHLEGGAQWEREDGTGAADEMEVTLGANVLEARGNARLTLARAAGGVLPRPALLSTGSATSPTRLEVQCARYRLTPEGAHFEGAVVVQEMRPQGAPARLECAELEVTASAEGQLAAMDARGAVNFQDGPLRLTGRRVTYEAARGWVEVTGPATWQDGPRSGSGDRLWMDATRQTFGVEGRARVLWPRPATGALLGLAGPPPGRAGEDGAVPLRSESTDEASVVHVQCAAYAWSPERLQFTGGVLVEDPQVTLTCGRLTVERLQEEGSGPDLTAEEQVVITLHSPGQPRVTATCEQAVYLAQTEQLRLTGQPVIEREDGSRFTAEAIEYHRLTGVISTVGTVRARVESADGPLTNALPGVPWPR